MNKRGVEERQILYVAYLVLVLVSMVFLGGKVNSEARGETFHQIYYSRDIAYAANLFGRGNLTVNYPLKQDFNFVIADGRVAIRKSDTIIYPYSDGKYYSVKAEKEGDKLVLRKA